MTLHEGDRAGDFTVECDECGRRMRLQRGDLTFGNPPNLSPRVNWQQTDDGKHYCPQHRQE